RVHHTGISTRDSGKHRDRANPLIPQYTLYQYFFVDGHRMGDVYTPGPPKRFSSPVVLALHEYLQELLAAVYFAISTKEPMRYERVALAYHGFNIGPDYLEFGRSYRIRRVNHQGSNRESVVKRVTPTLFHEARILRLLSSDFMSDSSNHTAAASHMLWGDRIHITPFYHRCYDVALTPAGVIEFSRQLAEDISLRNLLVAFNPQLMNSNHDALPPVVDIWHECAAPPEGTLGVDAFAYDMLGVGQTIASFCVNRRIQGEYEDFEWPLEFVDLQNRLRSDDPRQRPTANSALSILTELQKTVEIPERPSQYYRGPYDLRRSTSRYPCIANGTELPSFNLSSDEI
ncbi:hypothetical protein FRB90_006963, partial [Tulasnella sp. 427]